MVRLVFIYQYYHFRPKTLKLVNVLHSCTVKAQFSWTLNILPTIIESDKILNYVQRYCYSNIQVNLALPFGNDLK